eukprot:1936826-Rhodomonas_salina.2
MLSAWSHIGSLAPSPPPPSPPCEECEAQQRGERKEGPPPSLGTSEGAREDKTHSRRWRARRAAWSAKSDPSPSSSVTSPAAACFEPRQGPRVDDDSSRRDKVP